MLTSRLARLSTAVFEGAVTKTAPQRWEAHMCTMWTATSVLPVPGGPCTRANSARQVSAMACSWEGFGAGIEGALHSMGIYIREGVGTGTPCSPKIAERKNADMEKGWSEYTTVQSVVARSLLSATSLKP